MRKNIFLDCTSKIVFLFNDGQAPCIPKQKEKDTCMESGNKTLPLAFMSDCFIWLIL